MRGAGGSFLQHTFCVDACVRVASKRPSMASAAYLRAVLPSHTCLFHL